MEIRSFLGSIAEVLLMSFALFDRDTYAATARARFQKMGYGLKSLHTVDNPVRAVRETEAIFVGGGNTFRLLKRVSDY